MADQPGCPRVATALRGQVGLGCGPAVPGLGVEPGAGGTVPGFEQWVVSIRGGRLSHGWWCGDGPCPAGVWPSLRAGPGRYVSVPSWCPTS